MVRPLPHIVLRSLCRSRGLAWLLLATVVLSAGWAMVPAAAQDAGLVERPVTIRVTWGGGMFVAVGEHIVVQDSPQ
jgi:hypothetical protein